DAAILNQRIQCNFNIIKSEPMERISTYGGPAGSGGPFPLYPIGTTSPQPQSSMQTLRPKVSPGRTSPMEYSPYNPALTQSQLSPQYPSTSSHIVQQSSTGTYPQQFPYIHDMLQAQPQESVYNYYEIKNHVTGGAEATDITSVLDMDSQQYSFDLSFNQLDSAELAAFGTALSENLSSGLSISDSKPETSKGANAVPSNVEESNNMTDSFTRITNNTIQELCTLNNMYKPTREVD
ncbi:hypothetical protein WN48_07265, partial [Eufriesea mexicana]